MDKLQLIKAEIERRIENLKFSIEHNSVTKESKLDLEGNITTLNSILQFIDSLPEEPKKQPKFKVGDIIKGPHNNIFEIKEVLENQYVLHSKNGDELNSITIVDRSSCVVEEPASEDLDFLVISLEETIGTSPHSREVIKEHLQKAAEWGRNHFEDKSEMVSGDLEEAANQHSKQVFHGLLVEDNITAFKAGAEWQKQKDQETIELAEDHAMLAGMNKMKEEMMKDAVDGEVVYSVGTALEKQYKVISERVTMNGIKLGDKVKIIIIKED